jgi:hypothetical protein
MSGAGNPRFEMVRIGFAMLGIGLLSLIARWREALTIGRCCIASRC